METNNKLRETLVRIKSIADDYEQCVTKAGALDTIYDLACTALAEPVRNCDVGTADEQSERCDKFCYMHNCKSDCPLSKADSCELAWAQMPYKEGGEKCEP